MFARVALAVFGCAVARSASAAAAHGSAASDTLEFVQPAWAAVSILFVLLALALAWVRRLRRELAHGHAARYELMLGKERAEQIARVKEDFLALATHEIRAPVQAVAATVSRLAQLVRDPESRELVQITRRSTAALTEFLGNVLDLARSEAGTLAVVCRPDDLVTLLREIEATFRPLAAERGNRLALRLAEMPPRLVFDAIRTRQIISNLLSNAIKFTEDGDVTIDVRGQPEPARGICAVTIVVADNGVGMTPEQNRRLFEPYAEAATGHVARFGGTGLGLTICKRLAEAMGGTIAVQSVWQEGTAVTVRLPLTLSGTSIAPERGWQGPAAAGASTGAAPLSAACRTGR